MAKKTRRVQLSIEVETEMGNRDLKIEAKECIQDSTDPETGVSLIRVIQVQANDVSRPAAKKES